MSRPNLNTESVSNQQHTQSTDYGSVSPVEMRTRDISVVTPSDPAVGSAEYMRFKACVIEPVLVPVKKKRRALSIKYALLNGGIMGALIVQIALSAVLTALGASGNVNGGVIAALGAIQTLLAGFLALINSTGQPKRTLDYWNDLQDLEARITLQETLIRYPSSRLQSAPTTPTVNELIEHFQSEYVRVMQEANLNRTDVWATFGKGTQESNGQSADPPVHQLIDGRGAVNERRAVTVCDKKASRTKRSGGEGGERRESEDTAIEENTNVFDTAIEQEES